MLGLRLDVDWIETGNSPDLMRQGDPDAAFPAFAIVALKLAFQFHHLPHHARAEVRPERILVMLVRLEFTPSTLGDGECAIAKLSCLLVRLVPAAYPFWI